MPFEQQIFVLIRQMQVLTDLYQLQAFTVKGSVKHRDFYELYHLITDYFTTSAESDTEANAHLKDCLKGLCHAFLEGVRSVAILIDMLGDWVLKTHETILPA